MDELSNSVALPAASTPADQLIGLHVHLPDNCTCGGREAVIGDGNEMHCAPCKASRKRLGPRTCRFLTAVVGNFGRPTEPVTLSCAIGEIQSLDLIMQPTTSGRLMDDWRTRRRQS
jgi:hypothetical protein